MKATRLSLMSASKSHVANGYFALLMVTAQLRHRDRTVQGLFIFVGHWLSPSHHR